MSRSWASSAKYHILTLLIEEGPLTDEQIQRRLEMNPSTQRPRRVELVRAHLVREAGVSTTESGRPAMLWLATEKGVEAWQTTKSQMQKSS